MGGGETLGLLPNKRELSHPACGAKQNSPPDPLCDIYIYIYIFSSLCQSGAAAPDHVVVVLELSAGGSPVVLLRGHTERPHPQKSDLINT